MGVTMNRYGVLKNGYQGAFKKVLCICSAGCLRAPTAAVVLAAEPFNFNTRACGVEEDYALIPLEEGLIIWADEFVFMHENQATDAFEKFPELHKTQKRIITLNIPDRYGYRDPELMKMIKERYLALSFIADNKPTED